MPKHPAKELGQWLKARRQERGLVLRVFAGRVGLSPAEYAEAEVGVVRWLGREQEEAIGQVLELSEPDAKLLRKLLDAAREAEPLEFEDVYSREQLEPMRARSDKQVTDGDSCALLDAVFKPLA